MQAIIPAAGLGTRMLPLSRVIPKELLPLGRKPALVWIAEELSVAGVDELLLVTSSAKPDLAQRLATALPPPPVGPSIQSILQPVQAGLGDAVRWGGSALRRAPFVVALGDCVLGLAGKTQTTRLLLETFHDHSADAVIAFQPVSPAEAVRFGIAVPSATDRFALGGRTGFRLEGIVEKPPVERVPSPWAVAGRYVFSPRLLDLLESEPPGQAGEVQLTSVIARLIGEGGKVLGLPLAEDEPRFDLGNYESWCRAFVRFALVDNPQLLEEAAPEAGRTLARAATG